MGWPRFIPGTHGLATGSYLEYTGWRQVHVLAELYTRSKWAGSCFVPGVRGVAAGSHLDYVDLVRILSTWAGGYS
jgi:hypothetical protein